MVEKVQAPAALKILRPVPGCGATPLAKITMSMVPVAGASSFVDGGLKNLTVLPSKSIVLPLLQRPKTTYFDLSYPAIVGTAHLPVGTLTVPFQMHCPDCVALVIEVKSVLSLMSRPTPLH